MINDSVAGTGNERFVAKCAQGFDQLRRQDGKFAERSRVGAEGFVVVKAGRFLETEFRRQRELPVHVFLRAVEAEHIAKGARPSGRFSVGSLADVEAG